MMDDDHGKRGGSRPGREPPLRAYATKGPCQLRLVAESADLQCSYRCPEGVSCDEGVFKSHAHPIIDWAGPTGSGQLWHAWETNDEDFAIIDASPHKEWLSLRFIQGIRYRVMVTPAEFGLDLEVTVTNKTDETFHNLVGTPCLSTEEGLFIDKEMTRTFIETVAGLTPLKDTDRGTGDPCRTHFLVEGQRPVKFVGLPFWGELSKTRAVSGAVLRQSADGRFTIGTTWDCVAEIKGNQDSHNCIHSRPGENQTGQTGQTGVQTGVGPRQSAVRPVRPGFRPGSDHGNLLRARRFVWIS